jgi:hypothetical protein
MYWVIDETAIEHFKTRQEAVKQLELQPETFEIQHGKTKVTVRKSDIVIMSEEEFNNL